MATATIATSRKQWSQWLHEYGAERLFDAIMYNCQGAQSQCRQCHDPIYFDIVEGGGVPDWRTSDGDYGCSDSPDTTDDGVGGHLPMSITARAEDGDERLRLAYDLLRDIEGPLCSAICPSTWKTGDKQPHHELHDAIVRWSGQIKWFRPPTPPTLAP